MNLNYQSKTPIYGSRLSIEKNRYENLGRDKSQISLFSEINEVEPVMRILVRGSFRVFHHLAPTGLSKIFDPQQEKSLGDGAIFLWSGNFLGGMVQEISGGGKPCFAHTCYNVSPWHIFSIV